MHTSYVIIHCTEGSSVAGCMQLQGASQCFQGKAADTTEGATIITKPRGFKLFSTSKNLFEEKECGSSAVSGLVGPEKSAAYQINTVTSGCLPP